MSVSRRSARQAVALSTALLGVALASSAAAATPPTPGAAWRKVSPASVGLSAAKLGQIAARARQGRSNCLVVVRDGKLAGEWYFNGTGPDTTQNVYSATKSVVSTLVGIAQDDGDLRIGQSASQWIPQWRSTPARAVTVRDLLSMDSGRQWSVFTDYVQLLGAPDRTRFAIGLRQSAAPGEVWAYNNAAEQTLDRVLQRATGRHVVAFARQRLFAPLGMTHSAMATDKAGNAQMFAGLRSTCRDMARFGLLMLDRGRWGGKQIVSADWIAQATGRSSTRLNAGYGYLWWLNRKGVQADVLRATSPGSAGGATPIGQIVPGAPSSMYWALGLGNQVVQIDPGSKTVVVRLGDANPFARTGSFGPSGTSKVATEAVLR